VVGFYLYWQAAMQTTRAAGNTNSGKAYLAEAGLIEEPWISQPH
jgi:hypothetical protein